ncbi:MAG: hypothetical protein ABW187_01905 [Dokdonella sp.]
MTELEAWREWLEPPAGGLARLQREIASRHDAMPTLRSLPTLVAAVVLAGFALGLTQYIRSAPQRAFERSLQAALTALPAQDAVVERGIARELPSSRADVRIVLLAPAAASAAPQP